MSQFFISCKESKIENNRSFYGCFHLGPFEPSQSITIANALRRTLLSELYGLSIVSVEIEGASHEYSSLSGVKDSVLDILLNIKEIVLKKPVSSIAIKPQIGYLKARGPGVIRASNLRLPPFIQCVDPDQYIATLADNGFLNMKFIIQYSNKWLSNQNYKKNIDEASVKASSASESYNSSPFPFGTGVKGDIVGTTMSETVENRLHPSGEVNKNKSIGVGLRDINTKEKIKEGNIKNIYDYDSTFNLHLKKRRLIFKKLKQIGLKSSNLYINMLAGVPPGLWSPFTKNSKTNSLYPSIFELPLNSANSDAPKGKTPVYKAGLSQSTHPWTSYLQVPAAKLYKIKKNDNLISLLEQSKIEINQIKKRKILLAISYLANKYSKKFPAIQLRKKTALFQSTLKHNFAPKGGRKPPNVGYALQHKFLPGQPKGEKKGIINSFKYTNSGGIKKNNSLNYSSIFVNSNSLTIDAIFNPVTKVNYIIEVNDFKTTQDQFQTSSETLELFEIIRNTTMMNPTNEGTQFVDFSLRNKDNSDTATNLSERKIQNFYNKNSNNLENIFKIKREITLSPLGKEIPKHNIIFEIWTNGSMHPRDAIYQGFKNLVKLFSKLNKINSFMINPLILNSLQSNQAMQIDASPFRASPSDYAKQGEQEVEKINLYPSGQRNTGKEIKKNYFFKKIKQNDLSTTLTNPILPGLISNINKTATLSELLPLNETSFLSTYMSPKLKNYYSKNYKSLTLGMPVPDIQNIKSELAPKGEATDLTKNHTVDPEGFIASRHPLDNKSSGFPPGKELTLNNLNLDILNLSLYSYTCLKRLNLKTIKELELFLKNKDLKNKLSKICLEEIEYCLKKNNSLLQQQ